MTVQPWGKAAWIFGPGSGTQTAPPASGLRIQTALLGKPRPFGCGLSRLSGNMIWQGDFVAQAQSAGGKGLGGGGKGQTSGYLYSDAMVLAIGEGPALGVERVWDQNGNIHTNLGNFNLSIKLGGYAQTPFGYLTTNHPDQALSYRGLLLAGSFPMFLGSNASFPNLSFEVLWNVSGAYAGVSDADPAAWITDYLTNEHYGAEFPAGALGSLSQLSDWAIATGMVVSDALVERRDAKSYLSDLAQALDSEFVWDGLTLDAVPYGDVSVTGNGATYTPAVTPLHTFTDADYMPNSNGASIGVSSFSSNAPVTGARSRTSDELNQILVEYFDRSNNYNPTTVDNAKNDAAIQLYGLRPSSTFSWHFFTGNDAATVSAHLQLGRQKVRNLFSWTAGQRFIRFEPMDVVNLVDPKFYDGDAFPVRITEVTENQQDRSLTFIAEEYLQGTGTPYGYDSETQCCVTGRPSFSQDPGPTVFAYWDATLCGAGGSPGLVVAAAGSGAAKYPRQGAKGLIADWYYPKYFHDNPSSSGSQTPFASTTSDTNNDALALEADFDGTNVSIGLTITATDTTGAAHTVTVRAPNLPQASIPTSGYGVLVSWDFAGNTWTAHARVSGGTVGSASVAAGAPMDGAHAPLIQAISSGAAYALGNNAASGAQYWSQLWIGIDDDVDPLDLTLGNATYDLFFGDTSTHANAPRDLNADGSAPTGCPPTFYFPASPSTGGTGEGVSTGCIAGTIFPNHSGGGSASPIGAGTIPAFNGYQAHGTAFTANYSINGPQPFGGIVQAWGSADVWISTDGGVSFGNAPVTTIPGPSAIGPLTAAFASGSDPDTTHTLSVDLTESVGSLDAFAVADADAGRSRCIIMAEGANTPEIIDYTAATLTGPHAYDMATYIRRGQLGTAISAHAIGAVFGRLGNNAVVINYPASLIGSTIHVKLTARNSTGGGAQDLAAVPAHAITLAGPPVPVAPATLAASEVVASSGSVALVWPASAGCGIASYDNAYNNGGTDTVIHLGNQLSNVITGLTAGSYTFKVRSIDTLGNPSSWTTTTLVVT